MPSSLGCSRDLSGLTLVSLLKFMDTYKDDSYNKGDMFMNLWFRGHFQGMLCFLSRDPSIISESMMSLFANKNEESMNCYTGNKHIGKLLIEKKLHYINEDTALMTAVQNEHTHVVRHLLISMKNRFRSFDVNMVDAAGRTVLSIAVLKMNLPLVKSLMRTASLRTDPEIKDHDGKTPLTHAVCLGWVDCVRYFLTQGVYSLHDVEGEVSVCSLEVPSVASSTHLALVSEETTASKRSQFSPPWVVGLNTRWTGRRVGAVLGLVGVVEGDTPAAAAVTVTDPVLIRTLDMFANIILDEENVEQDCHGPGGLSETRNSDCKVFMCESTPSHRHLRVLLEWRDSQQDTALHVCCTQCLHQRSLHAIETLLDLGVTVDACDASKRTPLLRACMLKHHFASQAQSNGDGIVIQSSKATLRLETQVAVVQRLLNRGADVAAVDLKGRSALWYACNGGNMMLVKLLLQHGAGNTCQLTHVLSRPLRQANLILVSACLKGGVSGAQGLRDLCRRQLKPRMEWVEEEATEVGRWKQHRNKQLMTLFLSSSDAESGIFLELSKEDKVNLCRHHDELWWRGADYSASCSHADCSMESWQQYQLERRKWARRRDFMMFIYRCGFQGFRNGSSQHLSPPPPPPPEQVQPPVMWNNPDVVQLICCFL